VPDFALTAEIALASMAVCAVHRLKPWLGLMPLFLFIGLIEAMLFATGRPEGTWGTAMGVVWPLDVRQPVSYTVHLPALLISVVLVYFLESTRMARQLFVGIAILYVLNGLIEFQIDVHALNPPEGLAPRPDDFGAWLDLPMRASSMVALIIDFAVIIVVYQAFINRLPRVPLAIPLFVALVAAMTTDAIVYGALFFDDFSIETIQLGPKIVSGIAGGLPAAVYFQWQVRGLPPGARRGIFERDALELFHLRREVEEQRARYEDVKRTFGRYVSPEVVELLTEDPARLQLGGEEREVAIVFVDIRGYSTISETLSPKETLDTLNRFFAEVNRVVQAEGGMVNNFLGDGALAVFGAPLAVDGHCDRAVRAGFGVLEAVAELNRAWAAEGLLDRWQRAGLDGMAVRVGVHAGPVVVGNLGSEQRTDYAVIGDVVNTAARLEALNKDLGTDIMVSDAVVQAMRDERAKGRLRLLGPHKVKGRQESVVVHTLAGFL
jgi:class 3 adenylate cyclase